MSRKKPETYGTVPGIGLGWFICKLGLERFLHRSSRTVVFVTDRPIGGEKVTHATEHSAQFSVHMVQGSQASAVRTSNRCKDCTLHPAIDCIVPTQTHRTRIWDAWSSSGARKSRKRERHT